MACPTVAPPRRPVAPARRRPAAGAVALAAMWLGLGGGAQAQAIDGLAAPGFTGLGLTPSAAPAAWGQVLLGHDQALPGYAAAPRGHGVAVTAGVLPGLELTARLATNNLNCNLYGLHDDPCRGPVTRDLAASFKLGQRFSWSALPGVRLAASVGATDLGGAATHQRAWYGVLGAERGAWAATAGLARGVSAQAALDGPFASLRWRAHEVLQLQAEAIGHRQWVGARATLPATWRPAHLTPWLQWQHSLQKDAFTPAHWWAMGVSVQLDTLGGPGPEAGAQAWRGWMDQLWAARAAQALPAAARATADPVAAPLAMAANAGPGGPAGLAAPAGPQAPAAPAADAWAAQAERAGAWAERLAAALARAGFDDIGLGRRGEHLVVDLENGAWRWNDLDALGVALGRVRAALDSAPARAGRLDLRLRRQGVAVWRADLPLACLADWLAARPCAEAAAAPPRLWAGARARVAADDPAVVWWLRGQHPGWQHPRLSLVPDLDTRVGTEYGSFDSTWGVDLVLQWPLWRGASADLAWVRALDHSDDYAPGRVFSDFRIDSQWYRAMLHQVVDLAPGLTGRASVGRLFKQLDGGQLELRWAPDDGRHRVGLTSALFNHREVDFQKRSTMASYRYMVQPLHTALELHGGRFWHGDKGVLAVSRHWFGDVAVALYLRRSRFGPEAPALYSPYGSRAVNAAGIEFSFPLSPRKDLALGPLRVQGSERFGYGVQSVVAAGDATNRLTPWFGRFAPVPMALDAAVHNMDRDSQGWLDRQHGRVREAARLPVDGP